MGVSAPPPHLFEWQDELGDALLATVLAHQLVGHHALAVACLHQLGHDALHLLLLRQVSKQLVVEDLQEDSSLRDRRADLLKGVVMTTNEDSTQS